MQQSESAGRAAAGKRASIIGIGCNLGLFGVKLAAGLLSGSLSVAADAFNNLSDASSSLISLLGFKLGERPADPEHPYGHGRYEYLAGLCVSVLILAVGIELLRSSIGRILAPEPVDFTWLTAAILVLSIAVKAGMAVFYRRTGRRIGSDTLTAAAADSRNDVLATGCVLAGALLSRLTGQELDGFVGLGVAVFILYSGFGLVRGTLDPLLGRAPEPAEVEAIRQKILGYPGVIGTHDLLVHDYGPGRQFASVHVEMSAADDPLQSHAVVDTIERDFLREYGLNLVVHMDPVADVDTAAGRFRQWVEAQARAVDPALTVHDLAVMPGADGGAAVFSFDCAAPASLPLSDGEIQARLAARVGGPLPPLPLRDHGGPGLCRPAPQRPRPADPATPVILIHKIRRPPGRKISAGRARSCVRASGVGGQPGVHVVPHVGQPAGGWRGCRWKSPSAGPASPAAAQCGGFRQRPARTPATYAPPHCRPGCA